MLYARLVFEDWSKGARGSDFVADQGKPGYHIDGGRLVDDGRG